MTQKKKKVTKNQPVKNKIALLAVIIILGIILLIGITYAWLTFTTAGTKNNVLQAGTLSLTLDDKASNGINLTSTVPMYDEVGLMQDPYKFTLTNNGTIASEYTIYLDDTGLSTGETRVPDSVVKYNIMKDSVSKKVALLSTAGTNPNRILDTGTIQPNTSYTYDLRLWLDENFTNSDMGKVFKGTIRIEASQIKK